MEQMSLHGADVTCFVFRVVDGTGINYTELCEWMTSKGFYQMWTSPLGNFHFEGEDASMAVPLSKEQCQLWQVSKIHLGYCSVVAYAVG